MACRRGGDRRRHGGDDLQGGARTDRRAIRSLRFTDEFVRHKLLDAIGDLSLMGAPLAGRVTLYKTGHGIHAKFMRELMKNKDEILELMAAPQADTGSAGSA